MKIPIEISARHVHLSRQDVEKLFGKNHQLKVLRTLSQSSDFAAQETVTLKTSKNALSRVRVVGPERKQTQAEITYTDARCLGIRGVLRLSGDIKDTPGAILLGPKGQVKMRQGVIVAKRHIHVSSNQAKKLRLKHGQKVKVKIGGPRGLVFDEVVVRVAPDFQWFFQVDTDEGNAAGINQDNCTGQVIK